MRTADGYTVKTSNGYPISTKSADDHDYPLIYIISSQKTNISLISAQKIYTVGVDQ
jgi:hypothetical protein